MKKLVVFVCVLLTAAAASAAEKPLDCNKSTDRAALAAAVESARSPYLRLRYAVRLAELENPARVADFDGLCAVIDETAAHYRIAKGAADDAKVSIRFGRRQYMVAGWHYAEKIGHPYEYLYLVDKLLKSEVAQRYSPAEKYARQVELLKTHIERYDAWNSERYGALLVDSLIAAASAVPPERFREDAGQLLLIYEPYARRRPKVWREPLTELRRAARL